MLLRNDVKCCTKLEGLSMATKRGRKPSGKPRATRASASLPPELYTTLQEIAKQKKVSVAWVIRDAAEKYIAEQWPLFAKAQ
jgi:predicted DNA-binding ribbon-helix-helix protein